MYIGDLDLNQEIDFTFTSRDSTGLPSIITGGVLEIYSGSGIAPSGAGITFTDNFNSVSGLNHVHINTSGDAFYASGNDYSIVMASGTVDGVSVIGETIALFSIENRFDEMDIVKIDGNPQAAENLNVTQTQAVIRGAASGTPTTTTMPTDLTEITDNHYKDASVIWLDGVLAGQRKAITGYTGATKTLIFEQTTDAASSGDLFEIV
ncbi:MAG: hypothetical protein ACW99A_18590 [Candidatus Kariarchaeaceae archaeon]|jgi:hypothetical protein